MELDAQKISSNASLDRKKERDELRNHNKRLRRAQKGNTARGIGGFSHKFPSSRFCGKQRKRTELHSLGKRSPNGKLKKSQFKSLSMHGMYFN